MSLLTAVVYSITALEGRIPAYQARAQELWETFLEWCTQQLQVDLEGAYEDLPSRIYEAVAMPVLTTAVQVRVDAAARSRAPGHAALPCSSSAGRQGDERRAARCVPRAGGHQHDAHLGLLDLRADRRIP